MRITVDMVRAADLEDKYPRARVEALWVGREWLSAGEVAGLAIPEWGRVKLLSYLLGPRDALRDVVRRVTRDAIGELPLPPAYQEWLSTGNEDLRWPAVEEAHDALTGAYGLPEFQWFLANQAVLSEYHEVTAGVINLAVDLAERTGREDAKTVGGVYLGWVAEWLDSHGEEL